MATVVNRSSRSNLFVNSPGKARATIPEHSVHADGPQGRIVWGGGSEQKGKTSFLPNQGKQGQQIEVLPEIVAAVDNKCEVYLDGGIRHGTDVFKALALGARAVFVGRPVLWGLVYQGEEGAYQVLQILKEEFKLAMGLMDDNHASIQNAGNTALQEAHYPYEVIPLIEGYSRNDGPGTQYATGSSTLVKGPKNVIVDTGNPSEKDKLLSALTEKGEVAASDIEYVVCTHGHSDHVGNLNLFPDATFIVSYDVSKKDRYTVYPFKHGTSYKIDEGLEVIPTPGHTDSDVSVIVENTCHGVVAITGDLFEKAEDLERDDLWERYTEHKELQKRSREKILRKADFIIPGHGTMFRNTRK